MSNATIRFKSQGKVLEAYKNSKAYIQVIMGPLGSAKTTTSAFKIFKEICEQKPDKNGVRRSRVPVTRNTYPDLVTTTIRDWRAVVPAGCGQFTFGHPPEHRLDFDLPDGTHVKSEVLFIGLDRADDVKKLRGTQFTFGWMNEMKEQPKAIFDMLTLRIDRYPAPGASKWVGIVGDTNAWDEDHWLQLLKEQWQLGQLPGWEFFTQPGGVIKVDGKWVVNPLAENLNVLKPIYYERGLQGKKEDWIRVNLANFIGLSFDGKPVHPDYSDSLHTASEILTPTDGTIHVGCDFGLTPAAAFFQRQPNKQWWGLDEIAMEDGDAETLAQEIKIKMADLQSRSDQKLTFVVRGDPSGDSRVGTNRDTPIRVMNANGVRCIGNSTNDTELRRSALDRPLTRLVAGGKPGLLLSPKMKCLRKALAGGFHYVRVQMAGAERFRDIPDKNIHSHIAEAAEYALMDAGEHAVVNSEGAKAFPKGPVIARRDWSVFDI